MDKYVLFQSLVGSRAHGLNDPESDYDYRGVFVVPTVDILGLGAKPKTTSWIEGDIDDTMWELGHFLEMAVKCNPTTLEAFVSPIKHTTEYGDKLRALFPYVWNSKDVFNAFQGYSTNQRKKFLDDKDNRAWKYAVAYVRTLIQGIGLLNTGKLMIDVTGDPHVFGMLRSIRKGEISKGEVINIATGLEHQLATAYAKNPDKQTDLKIVNEFLIRSRRHFWKVSEKLCALPPSFAVHGV